MLTATLLAAVSADEAGDPFAEVHEQLRPSDARTTNPLQLQTTSAAASRAVPDLPAQPGTPPATVLTVGDSSMYDATPAFRAAFLASGSRSSVELAHPGIGLTSGRPWSWREPWRRVVAETRPDLSIVMLGGFDLTFLEANGPEAYAEVVDELVEVLTATGGRVVWLSVLPCGRFPSAALDAVYAALPHRHPGEVTYIDTAEVFGSCTVAAPRPDGSIERLRKPDRWHLCQGGAERLARFVLSELAVLGWSAPPSAGWENGPWRFEPRFDDPAGGCRSLPQPAVAF